MPNQTNITPPRVPILNERTGLISREWYLFFLSLFNLTGGGTNTTTLVEVQLGPVDQQPDSTVVSSIAQYVDTLPPVSIPTEAHQDTGPSTPLTEYISEFQKQIDGLLSSISMVESLIAVYQSQIESLMTTPSVTPQIPAFRTYAGNPTSNVVPNFIGEDLLDTSGTNWYKATGLTNADWKVIT